MNEGLRNLGFTEEAYRHNAITRRDLFNATWNLSVVAAFAELASACSPAVRPNTGSGAERSGIRREQWVWTRDDIRNLGTAMMQESQFNDIAYAGWVLLENQQKRPSFSLMSHLFEDEPTGVTTVDRLLCPFQVGCPGAADIQGTSNPVQVRLRSKTDNSEVSYSGPLKLRFNKIITDSRLLANASDFVFKIVIAKEIFNVKALDMATLYAKSVNIDPYYDIAPGVPTAQDYFERALQTSTLYEKVEGIDVFFLADIWAHFLLIPNYLIALENKRIAPGDWGKGDFGKKFEDTFRIPAEAFVRKKLLTKNSQGAYEWNLDPDIFYRVWMDEALDWYNEMNS